MPESNHVISEEFEYKDETVTIYPTESASVGERGVLMVEEILVVSEDTEAFIPFSEVHPWGVIVDDVLSGDFSKYILHKIIENEREEDEDEESFTLPPASGDDGETAETHSDTKIYNLIKGYAEIGPATVDEVDEHLDMENVTSQNGNATYRNFIEAVARNGNESVYALTPKGWAQYISYEGLDRFEDEEQEDEQDEDDEEDELNSGGLDQFTSENN